MRFIIPIISCFIIGCSASYNPVDPTAGYIIISGQLTADKYYYDPVWGYYLQIVDSRIGKKDAVELYVSSDQQSWLKIDTVAVQKSDTVINKGTIVVADGSITMLDDNRSLLGRYYNLYIFNYNSRLNTQRVE